MQLDVIQATGLLQNISGAPARAGLFGLLPATATQDFGPAALIDSSFLTDSSFAKGILDAAYAARTQPPQGSSKAARKELLRQVANAMGAHAGGDSAGARKTLEGLLAQDRTYAPAHQSLGQIALDEQKYDEAERRFRQAHFFSPQSGFDSDAENAAVLKRGDGAVFGRARILLADGATREDGIRLLVGMTQRSEKNGAARLMLADALLKHGKAVEAIDQLRQALDTDDPAIVRTVESRAAKLVEAAPDSAILRNLLAQAQLKAGNASAALESFQRATALAEDDPRFRLAEAPAFVAVGRLALDRDDLSAAISAFEAAIDRDPVGDLTRTGYAEGLLARGEYRRRIGASAQAVHDFAAAARQLDSIDNEDLRGRVASGAYRAGLALESRRIADGGPIGDEIVAFQAAYDLDPDNAAYRNKLAQTRNSLGDEFLAQNKYKDAAHAYQRAYNLYPANATYRENTVSAFRQWGQESLTYRRFDQAIEAYRSAYRTNTSDATSRLGLAGAHNARGLEHLENGRISQALADFREAVHYDPDNAEYQQNLSDLD